MKSTAVRLYGANDLRMETFELPKINDEEILVKIYTDSICMSSWKAATLGKEHKRVPKDCDVHPVIVGHEFAGIIAEVGKKWQNEFKEGEKFAQQPALNYKGSMDSPGYSYRWCGGGATYCIMPHEVMELGCLLHYKGESFYEASLGEPMSCIVGSYNATWHTQPGVYRHEMGIKPGGKMAVLAGAGPMGLGAVDYALNGDARPSLLVVTDISQERLNRARRIFTPEFAAERGVELHFVDTSRMGDPVAELMKMTNGTGYDDVTVYAPIAPVVETGDRILGTGGCLNFFAGPTDPGFSASVNFYKVHYGGTHIVGTTGGNTDDLLESLAMSAEKRINPAVMITHIGGLDTYVETTLNLPKIPGGKKLIYTGIRMPLTAIEDFETLGKSVPLFAELHKICDRHAGLWCAEAEAYLLNNTPLHY